MLTNRSKVIQWVRRSTGKLVVSRQRASTVLPTTANCSMLLNSRNTIAVMTWAKYYSMILVIVLFFFSVPTGSELL